MSLLHLSSNNAFPKSSKIIQKYAFGNVGVSLLEQHELNDFLHEQHDISLYSFGLPDIFLNFVADITKDNAIIKRMTYQVNSISIILNGNQLERVDDKAVPVLRNGAFDFYGNKIKTDVEEYRYDENGALIYDANRGIKNIEYDLRNNPVLIKFSDGSTTEYVYTAKGEKLRTIHHTSLRRVDVSENDPILCQHVPALEGSSNDFERMPNMYIDSTDYLKNFIFENGKIDKFLFSGGYYSYAVGHPTRTGGDDGGYYYFLTDHLGNNRVVISEDGVIYQINHYYPFGAVYADASKNPDFQKYKYTGKELDLVHGLNTNDHGARQNYSLLGVWDRIDPMAEKYYNASPYTVCDNNPIRKIDSNGEWYWDKKGNLIAEEKDNDRTLSHFFNISNKESLEILAHNNIKLRNGHIKIHKGRLLPKHTLFLMKSDERGAVVHNTDQAVMHYYLGHGESADVGDVSTSELMNTKEFQNNLRATTTKKRTSNSFSVNMTNNTFHIGRTPVTYKVTAGKRVSQVKFVLYKGDGFRDPLDIGVEVGGTPYYYKPRTIIYFFKPIK